MNAPRNNNFSLYPHHLSTVVNLLVVAVSLKLTQSWTMVIILHSLVIKAQLPLTSKSTTLPLLIRNSPDCVGVNCGRSMARLHKKLIYYSLASHCVATAHVICSRYRYTYINNFLNGTVYARYQNSTHTTTF